MLNAVADLRIKRLVKCVHISQILQLRPIEGVWIKMAVRSGICPPIDVTPHSGRMD